MNSLLSTCCTCLMMRSVSRCVSDSRSSFPSIHNTGSHVKFCKCTLLQSATTDCKYPVAKPKFVQSVFSAPSLLGNLLDVHSRYLVRVAPRFQGSFRDFRRLIGAVNRRWLRSTHSLNALVRQPPCSRTEARILVFGFRRMGVSRLLPS